jgi:hypothetical protein
MVLNAIIIYYQVLFYDEHLLGKGLDEHLQFHPPDTFGGGHRWS